MSLTVRYIPRLDLGDILLKQIAVVLSVFLQNRDLPVYFGADDLCPDKSFRMVVPFYLISEFESRIVAAVNRQDGSMGIPFFIAEYNADLSLGKLSEQVCGQRHRRGFNKQYRNLAQVNPLYGVGAAHNEIVHLIIKLGFA